MYLVVSQCKTSKVGNFSPLSHIAIFQFKLIELQMDTKKVPGGFFYEFEGMLNNSAKKSHC